MRDTLFNKLAIDIKFFYYFQKINKNPDVMFFRLQSEKILSEKIHLRLSIFEEKRKKTHSPCIKVQGGQGSDQSF